MLHSGCVKLHQKFRDFVGLPMGLLREESPKTRMNTEKNRGDIYFVTPSWSARRESNPRVQLGKLTFCH